MIRQIYINGNGEMLYELLKQYEDDLYGSVTYNTYVLTDVRFHTITVKAKASEQELFQINMVESSSTADTIIIDYADTSATESFSAAAASTGSTLVNKIDYAYGTDHGVMIHYTYDAIAGVPNLFTTILIAKGSDGYPFIIVANPGTAPTDNSLTHKIAKIYHYPDIDVLEFVMCQFDTLMQTLAVPFAGVGNVAMVSKAPNAAWFPMSAAYGVGFNRMVFNTVECVTNGYWMLDDKQEEEG